MSSINYDKQYLAIRGWDEHFEIAETRRTGTNGAPLSHKFFPCPNNLASRFLRRIARHRDRDTVFSCFILLCEIASVAPRRGILGDQEQAYRPEDMADKSMWPDGAFVMSIEALLSPKIGGLITLEKDIAQSAIREKWDKGRLENTSCLPLTTSSAEEEESILRVYRGVINGETPPTVTLPLAVALVRLSHPKCRRLGQMYIENRLRAWPRAAWIPAIRDFACRKAGGDIPFPMQSLTNHLEHATKKLGGGQQAGTGEFDERMK